MSDWIPSSRSLPELDTPVLCCLWDKYYIGILRCDSNVKYWHFNDFDLDEEDEFDNVVAWMPLPAIYKEGE